MMLTTDFQYIIRQKKETKTMCPNIPDYFLRSIDLARMPNDHIFRETKAFFSVLTVVLLSSRCNDTIFILSRSGGVWGKRHLRSNRVTGQKKSMANSEEIKWWAITSARLLPRTVQRRHPSLSQGMNTSYLVFPAHELFSDLSTLIDKPDEGTGSDRKNDEDFLPRESKRWEGCRVLSAEKNFYLMLKNITATYTTLPQSIYHIHHISSRKIKWRDIASGLESCEYSESSQSLANMLLNIL